MILAKSRYNSICSAIDKALAFPGYSFEDNIDFIEKGDYHQRYPLFWPLTFETDDSAAAVNSIIPPETIIDRYSTNTEVTGDGSKVLGGVKVFLDAGSATDYVSRDQQLVDHLYDSVTSASSHPKKADSSNLSNLLIEQRWIESAIIARIRELRTAREY